MLDSDCECHAFQCLKYGGITAHFILHSGQWVVPSVIGQLPPCAGFSITKLPGNKALLIGNNHKKILVLMVTVDGHSLVRIII